MPATAARVHGCTDIIEAAAKLAASAPEGAQARLLAAIAEGIRQRFPGCVVTTQTHNMSPIEGAALAESYHNN